MKVIVYQLKDDGTTPEYVINGGFFVKNVDNPHPKCWNFIGIANDDALEQSFQTKNDLLKYLNDNNIVKYDVDTKTKISIEPDVDYIWSLL